MSKFCPSKHGPALYPECMECWEKLCNLFFCLVVGSRTFRDYALMERELDRLLIRHKDEVVIVSGGAKGADALAKRYAEEHGYRYMEFKADWNAYGNRAGYLRNREMHKFISHFGKRGCVAFWDGKSKGTAQNFPLAKEFGTRVVTIRF